MGVSETGWIELRVRVCSGEERGGEEGEGEGGELEVSQEKQEPHR